MSRGDRTRTISENWDVKNHSLSIETQKKGTRQRTVRSKLLYKAVNLQMELINT